MKKVIIILSVLILFVLVFPLHADTNTSEVRKCAVQGTVIPADAPEIKTEYKGLTYYFCCNGCKAEFEKNPAKYAYETEVFYSCSACKLKSMKSGKCPTCGKEMIRKVHKVEYICPMKSCNVQSNKPGKCPKCGMELQKKSIHNHSHGHGEKHKHKQ